MTTRRIEIAAIGAHCYYGIQKEFQPVTVTPWRHHLRGRRLTLVPKVCAQPGIASHRVALEWVFAAPVSSLLVQL
jgi:hypothetical protein